MNPAVQKAPERGVDRASNRLNRCRHVPRAPVYDWFTDGFDTQDLKGAKALLEAFG